MDSSRSEIAYKSVYAYVSLGSNMGNRREYLRSAMHEIARYDEIEVVAASSLYETSPVGGPLGQGPYLNAVALLRTRLEPVKLLEVCQRIEVSNGRQRDVRWGPRTLDIDILTWGQISLSTDALTIPHPRMYDRLFVLEPLLELGFIDGAGLDEERANQRFCELRADPSQKVAIVQDRRWWLRETPV